MLEIRKLAGSFILLMISFPLFAAAPLSLSQCAAITSPQTRLQCYDQFAAEARTQSTLPLATSTAIVPAPTPTAPVDQDMLSTLRQAWGKQIIQVHTEGGIMQVHTSFVTVNQIAYEVMLATMCGPIVKAKKDYASVQSIAILNQAQTQGYLFTSLAQCDEIAFKPVAQTRLLILGNTRQFKAQ